MNDGKGGRGPVAGPESGPGQASHRPEPGLLLAPLTGSVVPLDRVPDPVFAQRMVGDGVAIEPEDGRVLAPTAGTVTALFPTGHAVGLRTDDGSEVLIHVGIDTAHAEGVFETYVTVGERVAAGQPLVRADLGKLAAAARSSLSPVVVTNLDERGGRVEILASGRVQAGRHPLLRIRGSGGAAR